MFAMNSCFGNHTNCCAASAAAHASARIRSIMDTAVLLAVSIFVCILDLRVRGCIL